MKQKITDSLEQNYMPYTAHVIMQRALPEIDGLKPSQRRILYTMYNMGLLKGGRKKSQGIVGQTMFLHAHGDMAIYETMVRMSKDNEALLVPYIDSKGNFGKHYSRDMQYASARYTEAKLSDISKELFNNINNDTVEMIDNYDNTMKEPRLLPVSFPNILTNSQSGTAVGMSSSFPSFNLNEVIDLTIAYLKNKNIDVSDYIKAPDFPTGGNIIYDKNSLNNIYNNGAGSIKIRSSYTIEDNSIIFHDVPYGTTFESIIDKVSELVKEGKLKDIVDITDIYGVSTKGIEIEVKRNCNKEQLVQKLFKMTNLESNFSCNMNMIVNGKPQVLGVKEIIKEWIIFRANIIKKSLEYEKKKKEERKHLLMALNMVSLNIDKAIKIIRNTKKNSEINKALMKEFDIDDTQAEFVAGIKLRHLNKEYLAEKIDEIEQLSDLISTLSVKINSKKEIAMIIINQLSEIKDKYGAERKTKIIELNENDSFINEEIAIDNYNVKVFVSKDGYIKKIPLTSLRSSNNIRLKDGDKLIDEFEVENDYDLLIFTSKHNVYKHKLHNLDNHKPSELGDYLPSLLELDDEEILYVVPTKNYSEHLLIGFDDGKLSKIDMNCYKTKTNRSKLKNGYADKTALFFKATKDDVDLLAVSSIDKAILFSTKGMNAKTSKTTIGVQKMKSKNDSKVVKYIEINNNDFEYYRSVNAGVGKYIRKEDKELLNKKT